MGEQSSKIKSRRDGRVIVVHKARSFEEAERWDIQYWLSQTPEVRLEALERIRKEWKLIRRDAD